MAIKINGDNSVANPGFTGDDTDTGLQVGTNELKLVTDGTARVTVASDGKATFAGTVQSGGDPNDGGAVGTKMTTTGVIQATRSSGVSAVFTGYTQGTTTPTTRINGDGSGYFSGDVGIGTTSPSQILELKSAEPRLCLNGTTADNQKGIEFEHNGTRYGSLFQNANSGEMCLSSGDNGSSYVITFKTDNSERMRIDSSGNVGIGVTPTSQLHVIGDEIRFSNSSNASYYGTITHDAADTGANIYNTVDATNASHIWQDDGTERMRLNALGFLKVGVGGFNNLSSQEHEFRGDSNNIVLWAQATKSDYSVNGVYGGVVMAKTTRSSASTFALFNGRTDSDTQFNLRGDGNGYCDGSWNGGGADYAEYFEWSDGNSSAEDRRGISVVLDGDKIRQAVDGEEPIGVISGNPSVVGDNDIYRWKGKYLRDDFGTYIQEDYEVENEEGNTVTQQRRKLNPDYNEDQEYVPREDRPEWDCVGLMGKLRIRKGQVTGSRWIKMRDISDSVEEWLVR